MQRGWSGGLLVVGFPILLVVFVCCKGGPLFVPLLLFAHLFGHLGCGVVEGLALPGLFPMHLLPLLAVLFGLGWRLGPDAGL